MKSLKIIIAFCIISLVSAHQVFSQEKEDADKVVLKTTKEKTPEKVKESLKDYSKYKIANEVTYVKKNNRNIYKFRVEKGNWSHYLLINDEGKIIGIETGEH